MNAELAPILDSYGIEPDRLDPVTSVNSRGWRLTAGTKEYFLKEFSHRSGSSLETEARLLDHLTDKAYPCPRLIRTRSGAPYAATHARYMLYSAAPGEDRYREASVFDPWRPGDARAAGTMLARFHQAVSDFPEPPTKPFAGITCRYELMGTADLDRGLLALMAEAGLTEFLDPELSELLQLLAPYHAALRERLPMLPRQLIHGDFIKRNLFFEDDRISCVIDFDLATLSYRLYDLCLALMATGFPWPELLAGRATVRFEDMSSFLTGYTGENPLTDAEYTALAWVLPTCRVEFYLSLVADTLQRGNEDRARELWALQRRALEWFAARPGFCEQLISNII